jgi:YkoY family integral membrane protein
MWGILIGTVLWLVFLEGLLSADNALVLAMMVRHLPKENQKRALRYGMWGAFLFRFLAVGMASILLRFSFLKVIGGLYLLYLTIAHFISRQGHESNPSARRFGSGFWGTVISVELADIAFSIDSILAAVAMADGLPPTISENGKLAVVIIGGILGIITMRFVAGYFIVLLEEFKGLESGAYGLVAWIGLKLIIEGLHHGGYIPFGFNMWAFWLGMLAIVIAGFLYKPKGPPMNKPDVSELIEIEERV